MKHILLITAGLFHPPLLGRLRVRRLLAAQPGLAVQRIPSFRHLPADLSPFDALVVYLHQRRITPEALAAFAAYLRGGGGVLAIHSATASFKSAPRFTELLGGRFSGHGPVGAFTVEPETAAHIDLASPFAGLPAFTVRDELYHHALQPEICVHFTAGEGAQRVPVVWTQRVGAGRVCYASPGHCAATLSHPIYQQVLLRGLEWVSG